MYYKISKGTKLFDKLMVMKAECTRCLTAAKKLVGQLGFDQWQQKGQVLAGGISAFQMKKGPKPAGWKFAYANRDRDAIFPMNIKANKELLERINALPIVKNEVFTDLLKYDWRTACPTNKISFRPGLLFRKNYILIDVLQNASDYKHVREMTPITFEEYKKLSKEREISPKKKATKKAVKAKK